MKNKCSFEDQMRLTVKELVEKVIVVKRYKHKE